MALDVYAVRGEESEIYHSQKPEISREEYSKLSSEQFIIFAKLYLKDKILTSRSGCSNVESWQQQLPAALKIRLNDFFESIPDSIIDFSSEINRKLVLKYITSNLEFGFGIALNNDSRSEIYNMIHRLAEIEPRMTTC